jgi:hypothetical protein
MALLAVVAGGLGSSPQPDSATDKVSSNVMGIARMTILKGGIAYCCDHTLRQARQRVEGIAGQ